MVSEAHALEADGNVVLSRSDEGTVHRLEPRPFTHDPEIGPPRTVGRYAEARQVVQQERGRGERDFRPLADERVQAVGQGTDGAWPIKRPGSAGAVAGANTRLVGWYNMHRSKLMAAAPSQVAYQAHAST